MAKTLTVVGYITVILCTAISQLSSGPAATSAALFQK